MAMIKDLMRVHYNAVGRAFGYFCDIHKHTERHGDPITFVPKL